MGADRTDWKMRFLSTAGVSLITAAFSLGLYASRSEYRDDELKTKIENVQTAIRGDLASTKQVYDLRIESAEKRIQALETLARENTAINQEILRKLTILETSSKYQNETLAEMKAQLAKSK